MSKSTGRAGGGVIVTGDVSLDRALRELEPALVKKLSRKTTRRIARNSILPAARDLAPVDSGDLEESLAVRAVKRKRNRIGHMVTCGDGVFKGDQVYSAFLEFGTKPRLHKATGKYVGFVKPHEFAFLRHAVYDNSGQARAAYIADMREFVMEAAE